MSSTNRSAVGLRAASSPPKTKILLPILVACVAHESEHVLHGSGASKNMQGFIFESCRDVSTVGLQATSPTPKDRDSGGLHAVCVGKSE